MHHCVDGFFSYPADRSYLAYRAPRSCGVRGEALGTVDSVVVPACACCGPERRLTMRIAGALKVGLASALVWP